jgi:hypothetical protein
MPRAPPALKGRGGRREETSQFDGARMDGHGP